MASVIKKGGRWRVVNRVNKIPVGKPNSYPLTKAGKRAADKRAREVKCKVVGGKTCPKNR